MVHNVNQIGFRCEPSKKSKIFDHNPGSSSKWAQIRAILLLIINELGVVSGSQCEPIEKLKELLEYLLKP